jgi:hypothetical protein
MESGPCIPIAVDDEHAKVGLGPSLRVRFIAL